MANVIKKLPTRKQDTAALDIPIPDDLSNQQDRDRWDAYIDAISPGKLSLKFAQAVDQFINITPANTDLVSLPDKDKELIFSKWLAMSALGYEVSNKLHYFAPKDVESKLDSDLKQAMFLLMDFLKASDSPHHKDWEKRVEDFADINQDQHMHPFINEMHQKL